MTPMVKLLVLLAGAATLLLPPAIAPSPASPPDDVIHVAPAGSDTQGDGSSTAPFRTLTRAVEAARADDDATSIRLAPGRYDAACGERFPLAIPAGRHIESRTGPDGERPVLDAGAETIGLRLGSRAAAGTDGDRAGAGARAPAGTGTGRITGVSIQGGKTAIAIEAGAGRETAWTIDGVTIEGAGHGIELTGAGTLALDLTDSRVIRCDTGLHLDADLGETQEATHHRIEVVRCRFEGCRQAGVLRSGRVGRNDAPHPYLVQECLFSGNEIGLHFSLPGGDAPVLVRDSRFTRNRLMGMRLAGQRGDPAAETRIEGCRFEENGTGLYLTNVQVTTVVDRCRLLDSAGNGLFLGCFAGRPGRTRVTNCLLASNGASGLLAVSDGSRLVMQVAGATFASNRTAGLFAKVRHGGTQDHRVLNSIFWENAQDIVGLDDARISSCLVQDEELASRGENISMDPLFEDPTRGVYTLSPDSPAIDAGTPDAVALEASLDLDARPRVRDGNHDGEARIDIGAFERQHP